MAIRVQEAASLRLDDIYRYTRDRWDAEQVDRYITGLFAAFDRIESHGIALHLIPAEFGVEGFYCRHAHHFVYWRRLSNGDVGIVTILHERMHQMDRFREDLPK
ncbi:type II toxin-antitoxin system RelE/ParE family toxin [Pararhodobacter aggregans]|uniref:Plasmid stabilization protein n=1 Tax=Pararhodobacter aggregans TaxID=404875 RepID=A0A2T7UMX5_9RHOB|nr:type II toxin-antitoxin system RelE/ParE family toxin [Pararhodobacter aggregans]PTW99460.1 plasmid stabilization system protein ParE [Pararhodobacter aggregans]PVE45988.1 plasmid stabilization protein [Pararhodobacter aggregans]